MGQKRWLQKEWDREKVAVAEIVGKANPEKRQRKEKERRRGRIVEEGRSFSESFEGKSIG